MEIEALRSALYMNGKSPVMWLHEICIQSGCFAPKFEEKVASNPCMFELQASVVNFNGTNHRASGIKSTKKEAKQDAAVHLLSVMGIKPKDLLGTKNWKNWSSSSSQSSSPEPASTPEISRITIQTPKMVDSTAVVNGNSCQDLIRRCQILKWPNPEYNLLKEYGPDHSKVFEMECRICQFGKEPLVVTACANQKQKAKNLSAGKMLVQLQEFGTESPQFIHQPGDVVNVDAPLAPPNIRRQGTQPEAEVPRFRTFAEAMSQLAMKNGTSPAPTCRDRQNCSQLCEHRHHRYRKLTSPTIKVLQELDVDSLPDDSDLPCSLLSEVARIETLKVRFIDVSKLDASNQRQCFCEIHYPPEITGSSCFLGVGIGKFEARNAAAKKALIFLQEVTVEI